MSRLAVHQMLPSFSYGDAIGNHVLLIREILRSWGYASEVFAKHVHPRLQGMTRPFRSFAEHAGPDCPLIFHFSIGSEVVDYWATLKNPTLLVYHNITPPEYFRGVNARVAQKCARGREVLRSLVPRVSLAAGVSEYNRQELESMGFRDTGVLPLGVNPEALKRRPNRRMLRRFADGRVTVLHVGRIAPNKRIEDILRVFYFYQHKINPYSRLLLVGTDVDMENYAFALRELADDFRLREVRFLGHVTQEELNACYRLAHVYLCLSEHEGFCVPLVEAMHFDIPVVAYAAGGVPETLGGAGMLVHEKRYPELAELLDLLVRDKKLRHRVLDVQRQRLQHFHVSSVAKALQELLERLQRSRGQQQGDAA